MYLMVHAVPAWLYAKLMQPNPMLVFYFLRCLLGCLSASCEVNQIGVEEGLGVVESLYRIVLKNIQFNRLDDLTEGEEHFRG